MRHLDGYVLKHLLLAFAFFTVILTGVIWLGQSVPLIDTVIASGQSMVIFLRFSLYVLPFVLMIVLPLAAFAGALYAINKLYGDSELVVMMAAGQSPMRLARPVLLYGAMTATLTLIATVWLVPMGEVRLSAGRAAIQSELAGALIREGQFLHPDSGLTIFLREVSDTGRIAGLFLHDNRDPDNPTTYSASSARFLREGDQARLIMRDGVALAYSEERRLLARVQFDEFTYDLSELLAAAPEIRIRPESYALGDLLDPTPEMLSSQRYELADYLAVGHEKIVLGLNALLMPLIALAVMLTGNYQRRGFAKRMGAAIVLGVLLAAAGVACKSVVISNAGNWPLFYLAPLLAVMFSGFLLFRASQPVARPRRIAA
ncbi:LptF/LptG family permease [Algicella marina]|uniref:LptF/LptG family permease n=1 Tax=Algicella marina TaxID=2683284 RepID=A0A6P1SYV8_9RHOB|nr:LptF/LptG family permease [Algicella marina]QHQ34917.1 LptF/LptG family permease [Algicella marina]